ncbi:methylcytosine dioxygenase TET3 isoform X2 [Parambassis ranga]|uniref:Methylcytosine dioxygenase TET n=1 Tax=Parambassis ranga TaxID=210632 RepID=A0A6P7IW65_9TELE|nr:methylcytosine dioxygenase tet3-like isoform X2 [Parambassis ranga]
MLVCETFSWLETVHKVTSVDGPRSGGQMEIGSHDRLQEGALSLELANGVNRYHNDDEASMETEQQRAGSVPPRQCWVPGHGKVSDTQKQQSCWSSGSGATPSEPVHHADMEDAHNLVAFSVIAGSLPPSSSSSCPLVQPNTAHLYEKFTQETGAGGANARLSAGAPEGGCQLPEDLNTLQTALSQAKHGHKPPNCDCDGPDCPDYLEWLEKKIKLATCEDQGSRKKADAPPHLQQHSLQHHSQTFQQVNGGPHLSSSCSQQPQAIQGLHPDQVPCSKPPIPCSPQVLSIAKEKNISLQTAIAIDALTQLSGTSPQAAGSPGQAPYKSNPHHHQDTQNITAQTSNDAGLIPSSHSSSSRPQSVPPGLHTSQQAPVSFEHHRPQSHGHPAHVSPLPSTTSPFPGQGKPPSFSPNPQQWQGSGRVSEQSNPWMCIKSEPQSHLATASHSSSDPMSELKQLLGNNSGKFSHVPFKFPAAQHHSLNQSRGIEAQDNQALSRIKQESDSGEHYHHTASMGHYGMANGQQQGQHHLGQAAISHSTQAALQQHLHYKRNLFSNHSSGFPAPGPCAPLSCQNLKKWWPQMEAEGLPHLAIKQEPKEPKKKKNSQGSPVIKAMSGMVEGPPLPKPKQIIIKKTKQKASIPPFLPQTQITIQKPPVLMTDRSPVLTSLHTCPLPSLPFHCNSTQAAAAGHPAPAQSQVSISNSSMTPSSSVSVLSVNTPAPMGPLRLPVAPADHVMLEGAGTLASSNTSTTTPVTSTSPSSTSKLQSLINIDPKYEELIRQFEAEFGDSPPDAAVSQPMEETATAPGPGNQSLISPQDGRPTLSSTSQLVTTTQASLTSHSGDQEMSAEDSKHEPGTQSEATMNHTSTESLMEKQHEGSCQLSRHQEAVVNKQQQPRELQNTFSMPCSPLPKRMKIEASGDTTVLSTICYSEEDTPTKDGLTSPSLKGFLDSPLRYLDTPTKSLLNTPSKDLQAEFPTCTCVEQILEKDEGPYYNHLGSGPTVASIRTLMEERYGEKGDAIRVEKVVYTGREGKSSRGCPIAKWVIRRGSEKEKLLCLVRHRAGHHCDNAVIIILILAWEGIPRGLADKLYSELSATITKYGNPTSRRCGLNDDRTCACQGKDPETCGASFSFGCSWSMYFNGCKYARSKMPRKFRLQGDHPEEEDKLRDNFQNLATEVAPLYKQLAPQAYTNQCVSEQKAPECRLGLKEGRPFSGVTACMDFCAHAHKDQHNLYNGCTVVCTLTKEDNRKVGEIPEDEQLHVLPLYKVSPTDEFGSEEGQRLKMKTGAIQVLQAFRREVRKLPEPAKSCRQRRLDAKKAASEKKKNKLMQQAGETPEKTVVKAEVCISNSPQPQCNKAIMNQDVKPNIKKEPFNGSLDGYPVQAADLFNNIYPHPAYYARGGLPPTGQPSAPDAVNGYHPGLPAMPYGYYNYSNDALFRPKLRTYEGRNGSSPKIGSKAAQVDQKPDIQSLQARLAQPFLGHQEQSNQPNHSAYTQPADHNPSRPSSVSSEASNRGTPLIKQEPMDVPVYEGTLPNQVVPNTSRATPQPAPWPGHKLNGSIIPTTWDGHPNHKQNPEASSLTLEKQQFHQHPQRQPSPYPQQWTSYVGSNSKAMMVSPAQSPSLQVPPSPSQSPHLGTARQANIHQASPCPASPRPSTPHTGTPQPGTPRHWASSAPSPQPNAWPMGHAAYSPGLKHSNPSGAYPDKIWSKTGESRCSTPLGLQEKAWKSCGGSVAGSTPSPAPEGRLFPDALQQSDQAYCNPSRAESDVESTKHSEYDEDEVWSDSEHNFLDPNIGGVAVAPAHGCILIECARRELHATTPIKRPDRTHPTRISLVFYQHKNLNQPMHGLALWEAKMKLLAERALQRQQKAALLGLSQDDIKTLGKKRKWGSLVAGASPGPGQSIDKEGPVTRFAHTFHTNSVVTVSPYAFTRVTGPYSHFV